MVTPYYSTLSEVELRVLAELIERNGYSPVIAGLGDILTQRVPKVMRDAPELSLALGQATAFAAKLDRNETVEAGEGIEPPTVGERDSLMMRVFPPLPADHPMVNSDEHRCAKCHERFRAGQLTTLIPVDPTGHGGTVEALPVHAPCIGWDPNFKRWRDPD